jgi:bifunctional DNA-binding transcriptional regulator/antitoxin component of YhaV-PrlF toxin-antitoxin module
MTHKPVREVSFGSTTIQKLRRVTLDQNLLRNLDLKEGDSLEVVLLVDTGEICLRKKVNPVPAKHTKESR